ncbi:LOW QUALITY PROTEIN: leucine-rich repeat-containing protein 36 [Microcaecilia unicolor]|uniref:LOW QUALITY PROTEIN: leucine-rich repeat-containing protein 36 n=1 Tax=Microcaecilia unicolor TaxID=1415580 RepID=A0A6P7Y9V2_9AMPH|nr:LOW QUALITY PROTEIN: leucine-rich repeat-containing protein 36 [Microcaecilia unicolor]
MFIAEHRLPRQLFEMMALKEVSLSESWVWARVLKQGQTAEKSDMVESLSLQGSYAKKIVSLEDAFKNFKNLQSLDLSRNLLTSLQGIEYLRLLRVLNLYYNNIESLLEVSRLKSLPALKELDLRLNPVTRNEANYRFVVVHLLESLETLDDRIVRENEKKTAQEHFGLMENEENLLSKDSKREKIIKSNSLDVNLAPKLNLDTAMVLDSVMSSAVDYAKKWMADLTVEVSEFDDPLRLPLTSKPLQLPSKNQGWSCTLQGRPTLDDECQPLLSPSRSSLRCPGKLSLGRLKEGCRVTFAECSSLESNLEKGITSEGINDISLTRTAYFNEKDKTSLPKTYISKDTGLTTYGNSYLASSPLKNDTVQNSDVDKRSQKECSTKLTDDLKLPFQPYYGEAIKQQSSREKLSMFSSDLCTTTHLNSDPLLSALVSDLNNLKSMQRYFSSDIQPEKSLSPFITATTFISNKDKELSSKRCSTPEKTVTLPYEPLFSSPKAETEQTTRLNIPMSPKPPPIHKESEVVLQKLLELVDRYWNGSGSLLNNQRFLTPARELLSSLIVSSSSTSMNGYGLKTPSVTSQRGCKHGNVESLMQKLEKLSEENCCLIYKIQRMEEVAVSNSPVTGNQTQSPDKLRHKNEQLCLQVEYLNQQLKQYKKLQDTMSLLQDSQRCLVSTNDFLLNQLSKDSGHSSTTHPLTTSQLTTEEKKNSNRHLLSETSDSSSSNNLSQYSQGDRLNICPL